MISITPFGAAGEVTGSCYLLRSHNATVIVDFGMFQGDKEDDARNVVPGSIHRSHVNAVLLTHAHLDHCGRLPLLVADGFRGPIFATSATRDLAELILLDAAHIQEADYERHLKRAKRHGRKIQRTEQPLFDVADVEMTLRQFQLVDYNVPFEPAPGITATYVEAGHMLGSASIVITINDIPDPSLQQVSTHSNVAVQSPFTNQHIPQSAAKRVLFSGDIGPPNLPFLRDPEPPPGPFNIVVLESTYGDRDHRSLEETMIELRKILQGAIQSRGKVLMPSFAIGRAQNMLYHLAELIRERQIPRIPIFLDSPMAIEASRLYAEHVELFDEESTELVHDGSMGNDLRTVRYTESAEDSKAINNKQGPFIVIAGAGMCNAGRILHHLRHNIDDPNTHVVITGYQARGSLGRKLVDGAQHVSIMGEYKEVRAHIHTLGGFSAHAGQTDLVAWLDAVTRQQGDHAPHVLLTHGEDDARTALADRIISQLGIEPVLPFHGISLELPR